MGELSQSYAVITAGNVGLYARSGDMGDLSYQMGAMFADMLRDAESQEQWEFMQDAFQQGFTAKDEEPLSDEGEF